VFHDCSGGHTENVEDVWGSHEPYLRAVEDYDQNVSECKWVKTFSQKEISARISGVGNVLDMIAQTYSPFGSVKALKIVGDKATIVLRGEKVRTALKIKSTHFILTKAANGSFVLLGLGFGHALGMSEWH
ncbi:sporulation protein, partial [Nostoc punctiforme UO1]